MTIARNEVFGRVRSRKRDADGIVGSIGETEEKEEDRKIEQRETARTVHTVSRMAGQRERTAVLMSIDGEPMHAIAEALGLTLTKAKTMLHRAKKQMADTAGTKVVELHLYVNMRILQTVRQERT